MNMATAAPSAADRKPTHDRSLTARRLKELAANLELHRGFADVVASLEAGHGGTLGGVWGSSRALVASALARTCPGPLVIVAPHQAEIEAIARDLALFTDQAVAEFPAWEAEPGERVIHDEVYGQRLRVLKALAEPVAPEDRKLVHAQQPPASPGGNGNNLEMGADTDGDHTRNPRQSRGLPIQSIIVTSIQSLLQPVPGPQALAAATRLIRVGARLDEQEVARWLAERGGHATTAVELPGEFSLRGGILDVFAPDADDPVRIELFGDEVESIRRFDVATQRSLETLESTTITLLEPTESDRAHFTSYLPSVAESAPADSDASVGDTRLHGAWFMVIEPNELAEEGKFYLERMDRPQAFHAVRPTLEEIYKFPSVTASGVPAGSMETTAHLEFESVERFSGEIAKVRDELDKVSEGHEVFVVCETDAEIERLEELFKNSKLMGAWGRAWGEPPDSSATGGSLSLDPSHPSESGRRLHFVLGHLEAGF